MYFKDLTTYHYALARPLPSVRNIGWLDGDHPYTRGVVADEHREKLTRLALHYRVRQMRGIHACEICGLEWLRRDSSLRLLGSAEIWIPTSGGRYFASPDLIIHYIAEHDYAPPREFLEALANLDERALSKTFADDIDGLISRHSQLE